ncbi:MAG: 3-deoxy-manno-octulosonate cytidylyltransferase [Saprospiraceae bacterium]
MILGIIPARYASTRFPGKPLVDIQGKTMIQRVYEQASKAQSLTRVVVATDDLRIYNHVLEFGGTVCMTRPEHPSGTDRCAEIAEQFPAATHCLNIQGDEPFIQPEQIDLLARTLLETPETQIATLAKKIENPEALSNPNIVKVAFNLAGNAIYFSRHAIPFLRGKDLTEWLRTHNYYKHIGLYGFQRQTLLQLAQLTPTPLEIAESLEQLRWLENGFQIKVGLTEWETHGIDVPEDLFF